VVGLCLGLSFAQDAPSADVPKAPVPLPETKVQDVPKAVTLDISETLFTVLAAINQCGYDSELQFSDPLRATIRSEVNRAAQATSNSAEAARAMCEYYSGHQLADPGKTLAQYISLALYLNPPPDLSLKAKEAEMPPDAVAVIGMVPMLQNFYREDGVHEIWQRHLAAYSAMAARYHSPLAKMMFDTEVYLKLPSSGYLGRGFTVYIDPMGAPGQTNARNYGPDYYIIISPGTDPSLKMELIRHTYLHYLLDPLTLKYPLALKRLEPLLADVKNAPLEESFKTDISLLVTECLIRAIEARTMGTAKLPEAEREKRVEDAVEQGYILTRYFYDALPGFEKDPAGLRTLLSDMMAKIDVGKEQKQAEQVHFAAKSEPELLSLSRPVDNRLLITAEQRLSSGDVSDAQKLAQQALDEKTEDAGRALFILAEVATMSKDIAGARNYFLKALDSTREPKVVAWSHIYLGRIFDLQNERAAALDHYRAALGASTSLPEAKAAAERGLQQQYAPPKSAEE
jgi:hypothetical protein